jgi:FlaA1/EpsC-like NDP-sugar epimerase
VEYTGLRAGEKQAEVLWGEDEEPASIGDAGLRAIHAKSAPQGELDIAVRQLKQAVAARHLPDALGLLCAAVPQYVPSQRVFALANATLAGWKT